MASRSGTYRCCLCSWSEYHDNSVTGQAASIIHVGTEHPDTYRSVVGKEPANGLAEVYAELELLGVRNG